MYTAVVCCRRPVILCVTLGHRIGLVRNRAELRDESSESSTVHQHRPCSAPSSASESSRDGTLCASVHLSSAGDPVDSPTGSCCHRSSTGTGRRSPSVVAVVPALHAVPVVVVDVVPVVHTGCRFCRSSTLRCAGGRQQPEGERLIEPLAELHELEGRREGAHLQRTVEGAADLQEAQTDGQSAGWDVLVEVTVHPDLHSISPVSLRYHTLTSPCGDRNAI